VPDTWKTVVSPNSANFTGTALQTPDPRWPEIVAPPTITFVVVEWRTSPANDSTALGTLRLEYEVFPTSAARHCINGTPDRS
jgi:hypothetical protein